MNISPFFLAKKFEDGKSSTGKGQLTVARCDAIQNFYTRAIRNNKCNLKNMSMVIMKHCSSTAEKPRHDCCSVCGDSWYCYQRDIATGYKTHHQHLFTDAIVKAMIPLFERFGSTELLGGVTQCLNQSNNESFNHLMWNLALSD